MSNSLQPHGLQHARPPCPSPIPRIYPNSCLWRWWCHPTISSSVVPFSSRLQSFPASGSSNESALLIRWPKYWSFSFNISPFHQHWLISFRMDWLDILAVQGTLKSSPSPQFKSINSSALSFLYSPTLIDIHDYWKTIALTRQTFVGKVMFLLFNMLSRLVIIFLPRRKQLLISRLQCQHLQWFWSPPPKKKKIQPLFPHLFAMMWWDQMPWS